MTKNTPGRSQRYGGDFFPQQQKHPTGGGNSRGVTTVLNSWPLFSVRGTHRTNTQQIHTLPRTSRAGTHHVGPKQHLRESIQEAEEGRLGKLASFAAGGGHPLQHPLRRQKGPGETRVPHARVRPHSHHQVNGAFLVRDPPKSAGVGVQPSPLRRRPTGCAPAYL